MVKIFNVKSVFDYVKTMEKLYDGIVVRDESFYISTKLLFRGQANKDWQLVPSIARQCVNNSSVNDSKVFLQERKIVEKAKMELPELFNKNYRPIERLAVMQHYGLPTRLLDVTENSLVALYFALSCKENDGGEYVDGEVLVFKNEEEQVDNHPILEIIADTCNLFRTTDTSIDEILSKVCQDDYYHVRNEVIDKNTFFKAIKSTKYVSSLRNSLREKAQKGCYILFGNKLKDDNYYDEYLDVMSKDDPSVIARIIIPWQRKKFMRERLNLFGFSSATLFPDDINMVCQDIRAYCGY